MVTLANKHEAVTNSDSSVPEVPRYAMLDGWRGIAALSVLLSHLLPTGELGRTAVMIFFVISGYCITASAQIDASRKEGFKNFLLRRVRRIYPPYLLSVLYFIATRMVKLHVTGISQLDRPLLDYIQNLTLTQWLTLTAVPASWPFNNNTLFVAAYWSLCYEEQFYMLFAAFILLAGVTKKGFFVLALTVFACSIAWNALIPNLVYGLFIDYWMIFCVGILIYYRLHVFQMHRIPLLAIDGFLWAAAVIRAVVWLGLLEFPLPSPRFIDLGTGAVFGVMLVYLHAADKWYVTSWIGKYLSMLGLISFSLYLIHECNLTFVSRAAQKVLIDSQFGYLNILLQVILHISLATIFWYYCERPFLGSHKVKERQAAGSG